MINARAETAAQKPSFRSAFRERRCLIPADGFFEWTGEKGRKQPWFLRLPGSRPFAFAGLYEYWKDRDRPETGGVHQSATIITTAASSSVKRIHLRMPVILKPDAYERWLDPSLQDPEVPSRILEKEYFTEFEAYPVSKMVNRVANNGPECIERISNETY